MGTENTTLHDELGNLKYGLKMALTDGSYWNKRALLAEEYATKFRELMEDLNRMLRDLEES
jgi:hypothetical protein